MLWSLQEGMDEMEFTKAESNISEGSILFPHFIFNFIIIIRGQFDYYLIKSILILPKLSYYFSHIFTVNLNKNLLKKIFLIRVYRFLLFLLN